MHIRALHHQFYDFISHYNLFMAEEDADDNGDANAEARQSPTVLKQQKYSTWIYMFLLIVCLYFIFVMSITKTQARTMIIFELTLSRFGQLHQDHKETLSCPCSNATMSLGNFVNNSVTLHPLCSSAFVTKQWIEALYSSVANRYLLNDFRKIASYQFSILADLCSLAKTTITWSVADIDRYELATTHLHTLEQIQSKVQTIVDYFKNSTSIQATSFLNYLKTLGKANFLISALNTNALLKITKRDYGYSVTLEETYIEMIEMLIIKRKFYCSYTDVRQSAVLTSDNSAKDPSIKTHEIWISTQPKLEVTGFVTSCTVLEGVRASKLDCLYEVECLEFLFEHFPTLEQTSENWTSNILLSNDDSTSVNDFLSNLFILNWSVNINYSVYFNKCSPLYCTYTKTNRVNPSYAITLFISLYGGLVIIFRLVAVFSVNVMFECSNRLLSRTTGIMPRNTIKQQLIHSIQAANLFKNSNAQRESDIKQQKISTYVYLVLLPGTFLVFFLVISLRQETMMVTEEKPTLMKYNELHSLYPKTLKCSCFTMTTPYSKIVSLIPTFHGICSSDFVSQRWIDVLRRVKHPYAPLDWRNIAFSQFQLLANLCKLTETIVKDAIDRFMIHSFISSGVPTESEFITQFNEIFKQFFVSTKRSFSHLISVDRLIENVDQPYMKSSDKLIRLFQPDLVVNDVEDETNGEKSLNFVFRFTPSDANNSTYSDCFCIVDPHCHRAALIYNYDIKSREDPTPTVSYLLPEWKQSCSNIDSLLLSNLNCLYSMDCLSRMVRQVKILFLLTYVSHSDPLWFEPRPLLYNSTVNHFSPTMSIGEVLNDIMVEDWNPSVSYENFYESCAPTHCTYTKRVRVKSLFEAIVTMISMIGGLMLAVRLCTIVLVKSILYLWMRTVKHTTEEQEQTQDQSNNYAIQIKFRDQATTYIRKVIASFLHIISNLNTFHVRDFNPNLSRAATRHRGRWATRLYITLFLLSNIILIVYTVIQPQSTTKIFDQPSLDHYQHLTKIYSEKLQCSCSNIVSKYETFVRIQAKHHPICTSSFVLDEWQTNISKNIIYNLFGNQKTDYRLFLLAHLNYLQGLCSNSMKIVENVINQFHSTLLITKELWTIKEFHENINNSIEQTISNAPHTFLNFLSLLRLIYHGNAYISIYQTNHKYIFPWDHFTNVYVPTEPMIYDENCSCGLTSNCVTQAGFFHHKNFIKIPGLKMGCLPSESLLSSTLECFSNQTCLNIIQQYTNLTNRILPIPLPGNKVFINKTVNELMNDLFVESWSKNPNYTSYFNQCSPSVCLYNYNQRFHLLNLITFLLSLHNGLSIVLKWICPRIIEILFNIDRYRKKRANIIRSQSIETIHSAVEHTTISAIHYENPIRGLQCSYKVINACFMFIFLLIGLLHFSIYIASKETSPPMNGNLITREFESTTTETTTSTEILLYSIPTEAIEIKTLACDKLNSIMVEDLNNDSQPELIFFCESTSAIHVVMSSEDGFFRNETIPLILDVSSLSYMSSSDLNNDHLLDLICLEADTGELFLLFNMGNMTFEQINTVIFPGDLQSIIAVDLNNDHLLDLICLGKDTGELFTLLNMGNMSFKLINKMQFSGFFTITPVDLNNDKWMDIIITLRSLDVVDVFLGDGTGMFVHRTSLYCEPKSLPSSVAIHDLNHDGYLDIIIALQSAHDLAIYLGHRNGYFDRFSIFSPRYDSQPKDLILVDLNMDNHSDIVFGGRKAVNIMFGSENLTFGTLYKLTCDGDRIGIMTVTDFDCDRQLDLIIAQYDPLDIVVFTVSTNEGIQRKSIGVPESIQSWGTEYRIFTNDLKKNGYQNIFIINQLTGDAFMLVNKAENCLKGIIHLNNFTFH
ncbi:unnamed protein product [Adineta ricciae]|uniref:Uncharacterized protein n=1 Tax=Adineta ricciae TaxID=249248 RepID=A0A815QBG4_ADIRI|nr:unnamed protein product [Adineta ricciae]CAF1460847.1 unnamed protein product [Adineta ricciae]